MIDLSTCGVLTENGAAKPAAVGTVRGTTDVLGVGGTTGDSSVSTARWRRGHCRPRAQGGIPKLCCCHVDVDDRVCSLEVSNQFIIDVRDLGDVEWSRYRDTNGSCCRRGRSLARASALGAV